MLFELLQQVQFAALLGQRELRIVHVTDQLLGIEIRSTTTFFGFSLPSLSFSASFGISALGGGVGHFGIGSCRSASGSSAAVCTRFEM